MAKSYESLMGAVGRSVFYRPERQRAGELLSRGARPKLLIDGAHFALFDMSMNGLSFFSPDGSRDWQVDQSIELTLLLHDEEVYRGPARVARVDSGSKGARIGLGLGKGFLDLPDFCRRDDAKRLEHSLLHGPEPIEQLVPEDYKATVARFIHFYQFHRKSLDYHEQRLRTESGGEAAVQELTLRATDAVRAPFRQLEIDCARAAMQCLENPELLLAAKEYTETMLAPLTMVIPLNNRAYLKPLGYPGDYQVMLYYYDDGWVGDSVYARVFHKMHMEHPLANGVRTRKDLVVELVGREHRRLIDEHGEGSDFRAVSLGCGPARETSEYVARSRGWPGRMIWTLIDQEEQALSVAYRESQREISRTGANCDLYLLNLSFVQMLSEGLPLREAASQHFISSTGLFDYLRESRAQTLLAGMYHLLAPGGLMVIGNAIAPNEFFWTPEFLGDWTILYRTRDEMLRLAAKLPANAELEVTIEPSQAYYFLMVRKPGQE